jgi:hypothetical protein
MIKFGREAATTFGYMLFEYPRLDMELGLFGVRFNGGQKVGALSLP